MKLTLSMLAFCGLLIISAACNRGEDTPDSADIQREEAMGVDDIRETDTYDRSVPVENEEEMDMNRNDILEDDVDTH